MESDNKMLIETICNGLTTISSVAEIPIKLLIA
ncbi:hypothetical protein Gotur_033735 [Gossypium turneri]